MENRQQQILSEIKDMMASIRVQLEQLDAKMAELQYEVDPQAFTAEPIDLDLDDFAIETAPEEPVVEDVAIVFEEPDEEPEEELENELEEELFEEPVAAPIIVNEAVQASNQKTVVLDAMTA